MKSNHKSWSVPDKCQYIKRQVVITGVSIDLRKKIEKEIEEGISVS